MYLRNKIDSLLHPKTKYKAFFKISNNQHLQWPVVFCIHRNNLDKFSTYLPEINSLECILSANRLTKALYLHWKFIYNYSSALLFAACSRVLAALCICIGACNAKNRMRLQRFYLLCNYCNSA